MVRANFYNQSYIIGGLSEKLAIAGFMVHT